MWTFDPDVTIDESFVAERVLAAASRRTHLAAISDSARLVFSEADGVPGLIADRYSDSIVVQLGSAGAELWRDVIADALVSLPGVRCVYERSDVDARGREDLPQRTGLMRGVEPDAETIVNERGYRYSVGFAEGQKTGFYLDQRNARAVVAEVARGRSVLNAF